MSRPTDDELSIALQRAGYMRESDDDPYFIAKSLLNLNYRIEALERVVNAAKHYLHSGQGGREHTVLMKAIEKAEKAAAHLGDEPQGFID